VTDFFSKFGKVLSVRLRRDPQKNFFGKAYVEFATVTEAQKAAEDKSLTWGTEKAPLIVRTKTEYFDERKRKGKEKKEEKKRKRDEEGGQKKDVKDAFSSGLLLEVSQVPTTADRDNIKEIFGVAGKVRYVDFRRSKEGIALVRFVSAEDAQKALKGVNEKTIKVNEAELNGRILVDEEEKKYWSDHVTPFVNAKAKGGFGKRQRKD